MHEDNKRHKHAPRDGVVVQRIADSPVAEEEEQQGRKRDKIAPLHAIDAQLADNRPRKILHCENDGHEKCE